MIPALAVMIGAYIFTRMVSMLTDKNIHIVVKVFAGLTIIVVFMSINDIMSASKGMRSLPY